MTSKLKAITGGLPVEFFPCFLFPGYLIDRIFLTASRSFSTEWQISNTVTPLASSFLPHALKRLPSLCFSAANAHWRSNATTHSDESV
jgi:hypothetical protein